MGWNEFDNKHKKAIDSNFVSCEEPYERQTIKKILREEFPWLHDINIDKAIEHCCRTVPAPRPRDRFMECLRKMLGV